MYFALLKHTLFILNYHFKNTPHISFFIYYNSSHKNNIFSLSPTYFIIIIIFFLEEREMLREKSWFDWERRKREGVYNNQINQMHVATIFFFIFRALVFGFVKLQISYFFSIFPQNTCITQEANYKKNIQLKYSNILNLELLVASWKNEIIVFIFLPLFSLFILLFSFLSPYLLCSFLISSQTLSLALCALWCRSVGLIYWWYFLIGFGGGRGGSIGGGPMMVLIRDVGLICWWLFFFFYDGFWWVAL